jgi:hypothetical protein
MRQYERSGLTIGQFCKQEGLIAHQLSWWRSELKRRDAKSTSVDKRGSNKQSARRTSKGHQPKPNTDPVRRFVPVEIQPSPRGEASIEIIWDHPPRLRVSSGFDAELLREVLGVLEQR